MPYSNYYRTFAVDNLLAALMRAHAEQDGPRQGVRARRKRLSRAGPRADSFATSNIRFSTAFALYLLVNLFTRRTRLATDDAPATHIDLSLDAADIVHRTDLRADGADQRRGNADRRWRA